MADEPNYAIMPTHTTATFSFLKGQNKITLTLNASRISSSLSVSFILRAIIVRNSGKSMVPFPVKIQKWRMKNLKIMRLNRLRPLRWSCPAARPPWDFGPGNASLCPAPWWWSSRLRPCRTARMPPWTLQKRIVYLRWLNSKPNSAGEKTKFEIGARLHCKVDFWIKFPAPKNRQLKSKTQAKWCKKTFGYVEIWPIIDNIRKSQIYLSNKSAKIPKLKVMI